MYKPVFLVMVNISDEVWSYMIRRERRIVGRSMRAAIRVDAEHDTISRCHAEIWCNENGIFLNDLGSQGGTRLNGIWLVKNQPVKVLIGDSIMLADSEFRVVERVSVLAELLDEASVHSHPVTDEAADTIIQQAQDFVRTQLSELTPSELQIVLWMYRGYTSDDELGRILFRSPNTIRTQVASIFEKLAVNSRTEIVTWLRRVNPLPRQNAEETRKAEHKTRTF